MANEFYNSKFDNGDEKGTLKQYLDGSVSEDKKSRLQVSRKCKAGLYYNVFNNKHIHFYIADLDMKRVVTKQKETIGKDGTIVTEKDLSITAKELRYIFRNKECAIPAR